MRFNFTYCSLAFAFVVGTTVSPPSLASDPIVKLSRSGICHTVQSPSYSKTKSFKSFSTLSKCLKAGGRLPKKGYKAQSKRKSATDGYARSKFGHGWADKDKDCQNSRMEVLIEQSVSPVRYKSSKNCKVKSGK